MRSTSISALLAAAAVGMAASGPHGIAVSQPAPRAPRPSRKPMTSMPADETEIAKWNALVAERKALKRARQQAERQQWRRR